MHEEVAHDRGHDMEAQRLTARQMMVLAAVQGVCAGPLASRFANNPQRLGAFAAAVAEGAEHGLFEPIEGAAK